MPARLLTAGSYHQISHASRLCASERREDCRRYSGELRTDCVYELRAVSGKSRENCTWFRADFGRIAGKWCVVEAASRFLRAVSLREMSDKRNEDLTPPPSRAEHILAGETYNMFPPHPHHHPSSTCVDASCSSSPSGRGNAPETGVETDPAIAPRVDLETGPGIVPRTVPRAVRRIVPEIAATEKTAASGAGEFSFISFPAPFFVFVYLLLYRRCCCPAAAAACCSRCCCFLLLRYLYIHFFCEFKQSPRFFFYHFLSPCGKALPPLRRLSRQSVSPLLPPTCGSPRPRGGVPMLSGRKGITAARE